MIVSILALQEVVGKDQHSGGHLQKSHNRLKVDILADWPCRVTLTCHGLKNLHTSCSFCKTYNRCHLLPYEQLRSSSCQVGCWSDLRFPGELGPLELVLGSAGTGSYRPCKILSLVAHMLGSAIHCGGEGRKLCLSILTTVFWCKLECTQKLSLSPCVFSLMLI